MTWFENSFNFWWETTRSEKFASEIVSRWRRRKFQCTVVNVGFDFENENKMVGGRHGKLAKSRRRNESSPVCLSWLYHHVNSFVTRHLRITAIVSRLRQRNSRTVSDGDLYIHSNSHRGKAKRKSVEYIFVTSVNKYLFNFI